MRIVFMGTPDFAVPSLVSLVEAGNEIALVVTRPDAVRGRGKKLEPSPVKAKALELGLPVVEANRMTPEVVEALQAAQADIFCVAAYGCILPDDVLHMAPLGIVNVHASLLPRWRGAAPIQRAILAGDDVAGVSIMRIGHGVDTGAYCAQASTSVAGKHAEALTMELGELGGKLLADTLPSLADGTAVWTEQDESLVTHATKISKQEMRLDPQMAALDCVRHVLASSDTAPARCVIAGKTVRVLDAAPLMCRLARIRFSLRPSVFTWVFPMVRLSCSRLSLMASVLWPLLLGLLACRAPILSGVFCHEQVVSRAQACARCVDGGRSPRHVRARRAVFPCFGQGH